MKPHKKTTRRHPRPCLNSVGDLAKYLEAARHGLRLTEVLYGAPRENFYNVMEIRKSSGGTRTLHAVSGKLKKAQRLALDKLQRDFPPSVYAHGFVPKRSIKTNATPHQKRKLVIKLDLTDFFPNIQFARVFGMFQAAPFNFGREPALALAQLACIPEDNGALPQGGVLSPYIANVLCRRMDRRLAELARKHRCVFTRYADDLTFSTNDVARFDADAFVSEVAELVEAEGFQLNADKTRVLGRSERQIVTGIVVNDGLNVPRKYVRSLRSIVYKMEKFGLEATLVKQTPVKDQRASRLEFRRDGEGYALGNALMTREQAEAKFLEHLLGRFAFVAQVLKDEDDEDTDEGTGKGTGKGKPERRESYRRDIGFQLLLKRLHGAVRKEIKKGKKKHLQGHLNAIEKLMCKFPAAKRQSKWLKRTLEIREASLRKWEEHKDHAHVERTLAQATNLDDLRKRLDELARDDIRYWGVGGTSMHDVLQEAREINEYPPMLKAGEMADLLRSFKHTKNLGALTHQSEDSTPANILSVVQQYFEPYFYHVPKSLRKLVEPICDTCGSIAIEEGEDAQLDLFESPRLKGDVLALKKGTRLTGSGRSDHDSTSFQTLLLAAYSKASERAKLPSSEAAVNLVGIAGPTQPVYTIVDDLQVALVRILHSMLINAPRGTTKVTASETQSGCFEIRISGGASRPLSVHSGRHFLNGKLNDAVDRLSPIAGYWLIAPYDDGKTYRLDMFTGDLALVDGAPADLFTHVITFPNSDRVIDPPPVATGQGEAAEKRNVLVVDNNVDRRQRNEILTKAVEGIDVEYVHEVNPSDSRLSELDLIFIHLGNPEIENFLKRASDEQIPVVIFSGGTEIVEFVNGMWEIPASKLSESLPTLVKKIVFEGVRGSVDLG